MSIYGNNDRLAVTDLASPLHPIPPAGLPASPTQGTRGVQLMLADAFRTGNAPQGVGHCSFLLVLSSGETPSALSALEARLVVRALEGIDGPPLLLNGERARDTDDPLGMLSAGDGRRETSPAEVASAPWSWGRRPELSEDSFTVAERDRRDPTPAAPALRRNAIKHSAQEQWWARNAL